jgi:hypothetical protein
LRNGNPDSIADVLLNKSSVHNVDNLTKLIGDQNMPDVRNSIMQKVLRNSSTSGEFNPALFSKNFNKMTPEVKKAVFGRGLSQVEEMVATVANQMKAVKIAKAGTIIGGAALLGTSLARGDYQTAAIELLAAAGLGGAARYVAPKLAGAVTEAGLRAAGKPIAKTAGTVIQKGVTAATPQILKESDSQDEQ